MEPELISEILRRLTFFVCKKSKGYKCEDINITLNGINAAREIVDTKIPKKPEKRTGYPEKRRDTSDGQCPKCFGDVRNITPRSVKVNYCQCCGQAIDWNI
jgi:hypothetical protein